MPDTTCEHAAPTRPASRWHSGLRRWLALSGALAVGLVACGTVSGTLPPIASAPPAATLPADGDLYRLRVGDAIAIKFPLNAELNDEVMIGPDGRISTADAADVLAAGRTDSELVAALRESYKTILIDPRLSVSVKTYAATPVFVGGEVVAPGEFQGDAMPLTLSQAIARAGGIKYSASPSKVFVIRHGAGDKPLVYAARYDQVVSGDPTADVRLAPYDLVFVPRTSVAEAFAYFNQYVQQFVPVSWGFSYQFNDTGTFTPSTK